MSDQQSYDQVKTVIRRIGGRDVNVTMNQLAQDLVKLNNLAGSEGIVVVQMTVHVPNRRLKA